MKFVELIKELEALANKDVYSRDKIVWWLIKYEEDYKYYYNDKETRSKMKITYRADTSSHRKENIDLLNKINVFLNTYEVLDKVSEFYRNELYFKEQIELYNAIKNDVGQLNSWLETHKLDEGERYAEFISFFQNNTTLSGYGFEILYPLSLPIKIKLDESEFKYTLRYLEILERSKKIVVIGRVRLINDLEVIKMSNSQTYKRQCIVASVDDEHASELLVRFVHKKIQLLKNLKTGQKVKIYAEILGGKDKSNRTGYSISLLGWDIKIIN